MHSGSAVPERDTIVRMNRAERDRLADAVVAFMKGDIRSEAFSEIVAGVSCETDPSLASVRRHLWLFWDDFIDHPLGTNEDGWDFLRRTVAFLKTDLQLVPTTVPSSGPDRRRRLALVRPCVLAVAVAASQVSDYGILVTAWVVIAVEWWCGSGVEHEPEVAEATKYLPFRNESEWRACEPLLLPFKLPPYDPAMDRRLRSRFWDGVATLNGAVVCGLVLPLILLFQAWRRPVTIFVASPGKPDAGPVDG
jgi:hypothetical protein